MANCNVALKDLGSGNCRLIMDEVVRLGFVSTKKESGALNTITEVNAATLSNWQTLFDKPNFSSTVLEKVVMTDRIFEFTQEPIEPAVFEQGGYREVLDDGGTKFSFMIYGQTADYIKRMDELADNTLSVYFFDAGTRVWSPSDKTTMTPLRIQNMSVTPFKVKTKDSPAMATVTFTLYDPKAVNDLRSVTIASADIFDDTDFYSLIDADCTLSSPATSGYTLVIDTERDDEAVTGITTVTDVNAYDTTAPTVAIPCDSITESPNGTYAIVHSSPALSTGKTYTIKVTYSGYDIATATTGVIS